LVARLKPDAFPSHFAFEEQRPAGSWYTYPSEKYEFVSWDDSSQYIQKQTMLQTTNQPASEFLVPPMRGFSESETDSQTSQSCLFSCDIEATQPHQSPGVEQVSPKFHYTKPGLTRLPQQNLGKKNTEKTKD